MGQWADAIASQADQATNLWLNFKKDQPEIALALSMLPVSGQVTAAAEYYDAMKRGDTKDGVMAALQFLPMGGIVKGAKAAEEAVQMSRASKGAMQEAGRVFGPELHAQRDGEAWMRNAQDLNTRAKMAAAEAAVHTGGGVADLGDAYDYLKNKSSAWAAAMKGSE